MKKKWLAALFAIGMTVSNVTALAPVALAADPQTSLTSWTADGLKRYSDTEQPPAMQENNIDLFCARGEYERGQIVLRSDTQRFTVTGVEFTSLVNSAGHTIAKENLSYNFALYSCDIPTDTVGESGYGPDGGPLFPYNGMPDPLSNEKTIEVAIGKNQPIYVKLFVPHETAAGVYNGRMTVKTTAGDVVTPIRAEVFAAEVPPLKDAGFTFYNWMTDIAQGFFKKWNVFETYYKIQDVKPDGTDFTPEFYEIVNNWADSMVEHRQNMALMHTIALLDAANSTVDENGVYQFDWTLFDKYADVWLQHGMTKLAGIHFTYYGKDVMLEGGENGSADFVWKEYAPSKQHDMNADQWYRQYLPALAKHLEEFDITKYPQFKGTDKKTLFDIWYQHLYDEPGDAALWEYYAKLTDKYLVNSQGKTVRLLDADGRAVTLHSPYSNYEDTLVAVLSIIPDYLKEYQAAQASGKEFWSYVCMNPPKPWLNRYIGQPDTTYPLLFWYEAQVGATGYLHWAWNVWNVGWFYDGDSMLVYPDLKNNSIQNTIRFEGQCDGIEDWELVQLARKNDPEKTTQLLKMAVPNPKGGYVTDLADFRQLRLALLKIASGEQDVVLPDIDSTSTTAPEPPEGAYYVDNLDPVVKYKDMEPYHHKTEEESYRKSVHYQNYDGPMGSEGGWTELEFTGTGIEVMGEQRPQRGDMKVELYRKNADGSEALVEETIVNSQSETIRPFYIVYKKTGMEYGDYRIRVTNIRTENGKQFTQMVLDAYIVHTLRSDGTSDVVRTTAVQTENGSLTLFKDGTELAERDSVFRGSTVKVVTKPRAGYYCQNILVNGKPVTMQDGGYTIENIQNDVVVAATFIKVPDDVPVHSNLALGQKVTSSGVAANHGYTDQGAVDGVKQLGKENSHNGWSNADDATKYDTWVQVELAQKSQIDEIVTSWSEWGYCPETYEIQTSLTGEEGSYTTVYTQKGIETGLDHSHTFAPTEAKFVRMYIPKNPQSQWAGYALGELEVWGMPSTVSAGTNVALNQKVTANSVASQYGYTEQGAVDGRKEFKPTSQVWSNNNDAKTTDPWLQVELESPTKINTVNLTWASEEIYCPARYEIQISQNGSDYTPVYKQESKVVGENQHTFASIEAKYVRLWIPKDENASWEAYALAEMEVLKAADAPEPCDKSKLKELIAQAETKKEEEYMPDSWGAFSTALDQALLCAGDQYASEKDIATAEHELKNAMDQLILRSKNITITPAKDAGFTAEMLTANRSPAFTIEGAVSAMLKAGNTTSDIALKDNFVQLAELNDGNYVLLATDAEGNQQYLAFEVDAAIPQISGLPANGYAYDNVKVVVEDPNLLSASINENVLQVNNGKAVGEIKEAGIYTITACDQVKNKTSQKIELVSRTPLLLAVAEAKELKQADYSEATWKTFADSLAKAEEMLQRDDVGNAQINEMELELRAAMKKLETIDQTEENLKKANAVIEKINGIGEVTLEKETAITEARAAYEALTEAQKALVTNLDVLTAAEKALAELKGSEEDKAAANAVVEKINGIGEVTLEKEIAITEARAAYEALTEAQKALVTNLDVLTAAEKALAELKGSEEDKAAANAVIEKINGIGEVTLEKETAIIEARAAYEALTEAQKALVTNLDVLTAAEKALEELKASPDNPIEPEEPAEPEVSDEPSNNEEAKPEAENSFDWYAVLSKLNNAGEGSCTVDVGREIAVPHFIWQSFFGKDLTVTMQRGAEAFVFNGLDLTKSGFNPDTGHNLTDLLDYIGRSYDKPVAVEQPTEEPKPTETPEPTVEPTPEPTLEPDPEPTAVPTAEPDEEPKPTQAPETEPVQADDSGRSSLWVWGLIGVLAIAGIVFAVKRRKPDVK